MAGIVKVASLKITAIPLKCLYCLFCQSGDSYAKKTHTGEVTLLKTAFSYCVTKIPGVSLPQIELTRSFSSVLVDCLQSGCQTVEPEGGKKPPLFRVNQMTSSHENSVIKENPFTASDGESV